MQGFIGSSIGSTQHNRARPAGAVFRDFAPIPSCAEGLYSASARQTPSPLTIGSRMLSFGIQQPSVSSSRRTSSRACSPSSSMHSQRQERGPITMALSLHTSWSPSIEYGRVASAVGQPELVVGIALPPEPASFMAEFAIELPPIELPPSELVALLVELPPAAEASLESFSLQAFVISRASIQPRSASRVFI